MFTTGDKHIIYAPNGAMKSSFARVFQNIIDGEEPSDLLYPERTTEYTIQDQSGDDIAGENILVYEPAIAIH